MSQVLKIALILLAAAGTWYALTPPQPPPRVQERVKSGGVERSFGNVVRIHALVWKVCPALPAPVCDGAPTLFAVFCPREPPRRARRLRIHRIIVFFVFVDAPLLLSPHIDDATAAHTHLLGTARGIRAWVPGDGSERRPAPSVLQGDGLALHL
jgi:hypothetical protein